MSVWRILLAFLLGLVITAIFFRSILPRLPRIFFRGKLRVQRAGLRGIRGIEYRSKGFHSDSAAFGRQGQLEVKVQRIYASFHLPSLRRSAQSASQYQDRRAKTPPQRSRRGRAIITVHIQGVGIRLPRSESTSLKRDTKPHNESRQDASTASRLDACIEHQQSRLEEEEEERLQRLMSSPKMSPTSESPQSLFQLPSSTIPAPSLQVFESTHDSACGSHGNTDDERSGSSAASTVQRAGILSLHTVLGCANWVRASAFPALRSLVLRSFRAALYVLTSSLPMLTSLVSIEVDRIEIYLEEVEAVTRIGRAGINFAMAPQARRAPNDAAKDTCLQESECAAPPPTWAQYMATVRNMPTRVGSGAREAFSYLAAGISPSMISAQLRLESIQMFEARFPQRLYGRELSQSRLSSFSQLSNIVTPPQSRQGSGRWARYRDDSFRCMSPTGGDLSGADDSIDWSDSCASPKLQRSNSASKLSSMSSMSLRGFTDRWADWALEPLSDSDFSAETGWAQEHLDANIPARLLRNVPASARLLSLPGTTELSAGLLLGSNGLLGTDETLDASISLGTMTVGMDAVLRVLRIVEERKARRTGFAPTQQGMDEDRRSLLSKHLVQQRPTAAAKALGILSSLSISLPSIHVEATSAALLASAETETESSSGPAPAISGTTSPELTLELSLTGLHFDLRSSHPSDDMHCRWLGTCGMAPTSSLGRLAANMKTSKKPQMPPPRVRRGSISRRKALVDHRRAFLFDFGVASLEIDCRMPRDGGDKSRVFFIGDISTVIRSTWTPFGIFPASPASLNASHLLFLSDPNEHAAVAEATIGEVRSEATLGQLVALIRLANEVGHRRAAVRGRLNLDEPPRPKTQLERLRNLPRLAAGLHIERLSVQLDASTAPDGRLQGPDFYERKLVISVPSVDLGFEAEYRDEYVRRPMAEKRAAYKALRNDALEWPLSGRGLSTTTLQEAGFVATKDRGSAKRSNLDRKDGRPQSATSDQAHADSENPSTFDSLSSRERYAERDLPMDEALRRMTELQSSGPSTEESQESQDQPPLSRRATIRDMMSKTGKVRVPGYTRRSSMAAETRFSLRYQFETSLRVEAVEAFLALSADPDATRRAFWRPARPTTPTVGSSQHHLLAMHSFEVAGSGRVPGNVELLGPGRRIEVPYLSASDAVAEFRSNIEDVDVELWHPCALEVYIDIAEALVRAKTARDGSAQPSQQQQKSAHTAASSAYTDAPQESLPGTALPLVEWLPGGLTLYASVGRAVAHLGGQDKRIDDRIARGVGFEAERIVFEYASVTESKSNMLPHRANWGARSALELPEDLQLQAVALATRHGRSALARVLFYQAGIFPILDAEQATQQHTEGTAGEAFAKAKSSKDHGWPHRDAGKQPAMDRPATSLLSDSVWSFRGSTQHVYRTTQHRPRFLQQDRSNFIFFMPFAAFKAVFRPPEMAPVKRKSAAISPAAEAEITITTEETNLLAFKIDLLHTYCLLLTVATIKDLFRQTAAFKATHSPKPPTQARPKPPTVACRFDVKDLHVFVTLPKDVHLFLRIRRLEVRQDRLQGISISFETIMGAVESPKQGARELWEEAVRLRDWKIIIPPKESEKKQRIEVNGDGGLIRVPFGYAVNPIVDNTTVALKATKQLVHQLLTGSNDSIIKPVAEDPKHLPEIDINVRVLTLEAQDDPFETSLNLIWRAGMAENQARDERDAAFQAKVESLLAQKRQRSTASFQTADSGASSVVSYDSDLDDDDDGTYSSGSSSGPHASRQPQDEEITIVEARAALDAFNSSSWVRRYCNAKTEQTRRQESVLRNIYGRFLISRVAEDLPIKVMPIGKAAPLFRSIMYQLTFKVRQPGWSESEVRDFIHEKGAGIPRDTRFSLLVPLQLRWEMEEWRTTLRDLPMPMLHVPPTHRRESSAAKAWQFEGDIVIAEQLGGPESIRHVPAVVVPAATGRPDAIEYGIVIPKVAMPVKMYGHPTVRINTPFPTRLVWGQSIQPTIQDVMRVIDGLTPPPHDPSPKLGFWDKLPLILHGRVNFKFQDEGGLNIHMKGGRDPYLIEGQAAGWVKSWKGNVELRIGYDNPENEVFQILSHEYVLAIPDLGDYADQAATGVLGGTTGMDHHQHYDHHHKSYDASLGSQTRRYMKDPTFKKIVIKLTNGVRWGAGLHGERTCYDDTCPRQPQCKGEPFYRECRNFERIPHWKVITRTREHLDSLPEDERKDSFRGWRSHHLHFSLSVYSPEHGLPGYGCESVNQDVANNFYFTPLTWFHFWAWMRLFNSAMGLPIRMGKLFPDSPPPSPKFGRFLGTIKYKIDLAPLFITHQYLQFDKQDWARGLRTHVGVKARIGAFALDMHQRQQETIKDRPELGGPRIVLHKPFYEAEVNCRSIDLKTLAGQFHEEPNQLGDQDEQEMGESALTDLLAGDYTVSDQDLEWVDMEDFVELGHPPTKDRNPTIRMFPALICPQFNYYRKTESKRERRARERSNGARSDDGSRSNIGVGSGSKSKRGNEIEELVQKLERSKFGNENSHVCLVGNAAGPYAVQRTLAQERLRFVRSEIDALHNRNERSASDRGTAASSSSSSTSPDLQEQLNDLHNREKLLSGFIAHLVRLQEHLDKVERAAKEGRSIPKRAATIDRNFSVDKHDLTSLYHDLGTFDNRYIAHNPTLFYSNATRTLLLKYYYSSRLRRGYVHHMTATAVRYIRDLLKKKDEPDGRNSQRSAPSYRSQRKDSVSPATESGPDENAGSGADILLEMLDDTVRHLETSQDSKESSRLGSSSEGSIKTVDSEIRATEGISEEFNVEKSNVCLLLKPQIVLKSEVDDRSTVILSALRTRLQNYTVQDESCAEDSVNAVVLRRNFFALDGLQCFHPSRTCRFLKSAQRRYGFVFLPIETMVDVHGHTHDFDRIVPHTDASLYYDKFNKLRLSDSSRSVATFGDDGKPLHDHLYHHMDLIQLICPRFSVSANSEHFAALYNVVTDLILYRDPAHRDHAKRLEEMMFSYDFSDVSGLADVVASLQLRIREGGDLVRQYQENSDRLNDKGKAEFTSILGELLDLVEELNLIMDAITTSQDSKGGADREKKSALRFVTQAQDVAWNMMGDEVGQLLAKLAVRGISFSWLNKADNSAANTVSILDLQALNVHPDAVFAEIITKHLRSPDHPMAKQGRFLDAMWSVLPPVGGISIIDQFEFHLHPVRIQIELLLGRKIMDYIFGTKRERQKQEVQQKRIEHEVRKKEASTVKKKSPFARLLGSRKSQHPPPSPVIASDQDSSLNSSRDHLAISSKNASSSDVQSSRRPSSDLSREDLVLDSGSADRKSKSLKNSSSRNSLKSRPATPSSRNAGDDSEDDRKGDQYAIAQRNAAEMRSRASSFRTFVYVKISDTIFCLSYKGEKQRSITDMYDLVFRTPNFEYHNCTFGYVDLADNFKKDVFKAAWNQKSTLLKDLITHRPRKRTAIESIKAIRQASKTRDTLAPLDISVEPPTPSVADSGSLMDSPTDTFSYGGDVDDDDDDYNRNEGDYDDD
ncbi:hypothetical protein BCV70DRAFT_158220, partial [Testicularia cyperi]